MAKDLGDAIGTALGRAAREAAQNIGDTARKGSKNGSLGGVKGFAAGAGLAALAPLAKKGFGAIRSNGGPSMPSVKPGKVAGKAASKVGDKVGAKVKEGISDKVDEAGGAGGIAKKAAGSVLPGGGGGDDGGGGGKEGMEGVGKGRRMPVQQSVDVAVPLETAYNQWTQFEDWPNFMHRVTRVTQEDDDCSVSFATKIWGRTREFVADIETQRPDERIKWSVSQGITHTGVVTFHELAPRLTRIELNIDVDPGSLIEKFARGARHIKRAVRADLHRYKAFVEMQEVETGAWRGVIEDGELVEDHDPSYDEGREYSDAKELEYDSEDESGDEEEEQEEQQEEQQEERPRARSKQRAKSQSQRSAGGRAKSASTKPKSSGRSRSSSRSRGSSNGSSRSGASSKRSSKSSGSSSRSGSSGGRSRTTAKSGSSSNGRSGSGSGSSRKKSGSRS
jgi:uncharacterized membrane protein